MSKPREGILSVSDLSVGYKTAGGINHLFTDLTLQLRKGELVCFMGPNGAGKSSLIRVIAGLQKPLRGNVTINDLQGGEVAKKIAVVLTNRIEAGNMTVRQLVTYGRYPYLNWNVSLREEDDHHIQKAIDVVRINRIADMDIASLSDGQMQMAMIARAIAQDTPIILLDEPTAHLDLNNRVDIMKLLLKFCRQMNKAILLATHELDLALQTADLIWIAGRNKDVITGTPEDLVLNGTFDDIFQLKGFDLRTGKIQHDATRGTLALLGDGSEYLWTKNALERSGFAVERITNEQHSHSAITIRIEIEEGKPRWVLETGNQQYILVTIEALIDCLLNRLRTT
jgi:iron complex transport system ATP-binding protein